MTVTTLPRPLDEPIEIQETPRLVAISTDPENGRPTTIMVIDKDSGKLLARLVMENWDRFLPASAGHRLIEHGFMVHPGEHFVPGTICGWHYIKAVCWVAFVQTTKEVLG